MSQVRTLEQCNYRIDCFGDNHLYEGDNLEVLRDLAAEPSVKGQVRLVYIDPPFGTGQDFTYSDGRYSTVSRTNGGNSAYTDSLTGQPYLDFLRPRLTLLHDLLADDGSIYVHIDVKMEHYVKILMDSIFIGNFRSAISRIKGNPKNFQRLAYCNTKDSILFYSKGERYVWVQPRIPLTKDDLRRLFPKRDSEGRWYTTTPLHGPGETKNGPTGRAWKGLAPPAGRHWRYSPDVLTDLDNRGLIEWSSTGNPRKKLYADDAAKKGKFLQDVWDFKDPQYVRYPTEKNLDMLKIIVGASSDPGDLVMDAFCGSGTALVAAQQLGRAWLGIDNSKTAIEVSKERIQEEVPGLQWQPG
mgnify:CR=1 FL=1